MTQCECNFILPDGTCIATLLSSILFRKKRSLAIAFAGVQYISSTDAFSTAYVSRYLDEVSLQKTMFSPVTMYRWGNEVCHGFTTNTFAAFYGQCLYGRDISHVTLSNGHKIKSYKLTPEHTVVNFVERPNYTIPELQQEYCFDNDQHACRHKLSTSFVEHAVTSLGELYTGLTTHAEAQSDSIIYNTQILPVDEIGNVVIPELYTLHRTNSCIASCTFAIGYFPAYVINKTIVQSGCEGDFCYWYSSCVADPTGNINLTTYTVTTDGSSGDIYTDGIVFFETKPNVPIKQVDIANLLMSAEAPLSSPCYPVVFKGVNYNVDPNVFVSKNIAVIKGQTLLFIWLQYIDPQNDTYLGSKFGYDGVQCDMFVQSIIAPSPNIYNDTTVVDTGRLVYCYQYNLAVPSVGYIYYSYRWYLQTVIMGQPVFATPFPSLYSTNVYYVKPTVAYCNALAKTLKAVGVAPHTEGPQKYVYSTMMPRASQVCFQDLLTYTYTPTSYSADDLLVYYEATGNMPGQFANLPQEITEFGFVVNYTSALGVCNPKSLKGCANHTAQYEPYEGTYSSVSIYQLINRKPIPLNENYKPEQIPVVSQTMASSPCLGSKNNISFAYCQYYIAFWVIMSIIIVLFCVLVACFIYVTVRNFRYDKAAKSFVRLGYFGAATVLRYRESPLACSIYKALKSGEDQEELDKLARERTKYKVLTRADFVTSNYGSSKPLLTSPRLSSFIVLLYIAVAYATQCANLRDQVVFSTPVKVAEHLASTGEKWTPNTDFQGMSQPITKATFVPPVGSTIPTITGSQLVCTENGDCTCKTGSSIGMVRLVPGATAQFNINCDQYSAGTTISIQTVVAHYRPEYLYSTTDLSWMTEQNYACDGSCPGYDCLTTKPEQGNAFFAKYTSQIGRTVAVNCCAKVNVGWLLGVATAKPAGNIYVDVFKYTLETYSVYYCINDAIGTYCYDSSTSTDVTFTIGNVNAPQTFTAANYYKNGAFIATVTGNLGTPGVPNWATFPDNQFHGYQTDGCPTKLIYNKADPVVWGPWKMSGCFIPSLSKHDKNYYEYIRYPASSAQLISNIVNFPLLTQNTMGLLIRNATVTHASGAPLLQLHTEYIGAGGTATVMYSKDAQMGNIPSLFAESVTASSIGSCYFVFGSAVNSNCTLSIEWATATTQRSFLVAVSVADDYYSRVVSEMVLTPDVQQYMLRFNAYNKQDELTVDLRVAGVLVAQLTTTDIIYQKGGGVDQTEDIIDGNVPIGGANVNMNPQNIGIIVGVSLGIAAIIILLILVWCFCCGGRCCTCPTRR